MSITTVTNEAVVGAEGDGFSVSFTTGTGIDGAVLHVRRGRWLPLDVAWRVAERVGYPGAFVVSGTRPLDGRAHLLTALPDDGRRFASVDEARAFALERGYLRRYFTSPSLREQRRRNWAERESR